MDIFTNISYTSSKYYCYDSIQNSFLNPFPMAAPAVVYPTSK